MADTKQEVLWTSTTVAVVAPVWLQDALLVFLHSAPDLKLIACTVTVQVLLALDLEQIPELIILEADPKSAQAQNQVKYLKTAWPSCRLIVLIHHQNQTALVQEAGADEVLLSGVSPSQLMLTISRFRRVDSSAR